MSMRDLRRDHYFWLALALAVNSVGSIVLFGARAYANLTGGLSRMLYGWEGFFIGMGLVIVLFGKAMMIWLADLEGEQPRWLYSMGLITVLWTGLCALLVF